MTVEAVYNYRGDPNSIVEIDTTWFLWFNTVLVAFSLTFVVHANCFYNAVILLKRNPKNKLFLASAIQNMCAVACHLSRVTDYFFLTDCHAKPYHNYAQYWISLTIMDLIVVYRDIDRLQRLTKISNFTHYALWTMLGIVPTLFKSITMIMTILSLKGSMGQFAICNLALDDVYFDLSHWSWVVYHVMLFAFHCYIMRLVNLNQKQLQQQGESHVEGDYGTSILMVADVTTVGFYLTLIFTKLSPGVPDVILQCLWAIESKCTVEMLEAHSQELAITPIDLHHHFGKPSNKFFTSQAGTEDLDLEGRTAYRSQPTATTSSTESDDTIDPLPPRLLHPDLSHDSFPNVTPSPSHPSVQRMLP